MPSVTERTREEIDRDIIIQEALARDFVRTKSLAVWLKENRGIEGSVDAIVKGIERYEPAARTNESRKEAWAALKTATVNEYGPVCALTVNDDTEFRRSLSTLYQEIPVWEEELLIAIPSNRTITVICEKDYLEDVKDFAAEIVGFEKLTITTGLRAVSLEVHGRHPDGPNPMLGLIVPALRAMGINLLFVANTLTEVLLCIPEEDHTDANAFLYEIVDLAKTSAPDRE